jgi:UDP-N-acetylmuramyl pentapeptide phosphotransferase/UDP-N-acetylglucosamine-1-phosphate transferase
MSTRWTLAFGLAAWVGLIGNGGLRRLARAARSWSRPDFWDQELRRLGGIVLAVGSVTGWAVAPDRPRWLVATAVAGVAIAVAGLATDRRVISNRARLAVVTAAAVLVVAGGVRGEVLGSAGIDAVVTVVWIALVTNAFGRLGHADGMAIAIALVAASGVFGVAAGHDAVTATVGIALAGACVALLVYNTRPASLAAGRAGIGFAGFVLAVATVQLDPGTSPPSGLLVPLLLLGLPLADLVGVTASRLWHGVPLRQPRRDHLLHRLRARGWSRGRAIGTLVAAQTLLTMVAVLVGRDLVSVAWALLATAAVTIVLTASAGRDQVAEEGGLPRPRARVAIQLVVGTLLAFGALNALAAWQGYSQMRAGQRALDQALVAGRDGRTEAARSAFGRAADKFGSADAWLGGPLGWSTRAVPVLAENFRAARELAAGGSEVSDAGARLADAAGERLRVRAGTVRVDEVRRITPDIEAAAALLEDVLDEIGDLREPMLVGPVRDRVDEARDELVAAAREADHAVAAAKVAPAIFGADRPRRYFLAVQNPAELRATGGIIGNWGILTADDGQVELDDFLRTRVLNEPGVGLDESSRRLDAPAEFLTRYERFTPAQVWQNLNMSPDFPTVARAITNLYPQATGQFVDGVIAVDPVGLEALLELTGPVLVADWPEPITAENVIDVTLRQQYDAFGLAEREEFLGDVAEAVWEQALEGNLGNPARLAKILGKTGRQGHLQLWFADPEEAALAVRLGVGGAVPRLGSDSLLVTNQNSSANKVDFYLTRRLDYSVRLTPQPGTTRVRANAELDVTLANAAPAGVSSVALGPWDERFEPGEDRSFVSVYTPLAFTAASLDGAPTQLEAATELGRNVFSGYVGVPAGAARTLSVDMRGTVVLAPGGWYELDVVRQPTLWPDDVTVVVEVPDGWRITDAEGLELLSPRRAGAQVSLERTGRMRVRLEPAG